MNKTKIEWVKNPDGTQGYTWNPITGCLNHVGSLCKGGDFPCYAYRLAHGRLKGRYLANFNIAGINCPDTPCSECGQEPHCNDPFYPRFWSERLYLPFHSKSKGIFVCDMGELFGDWIPEEWQENIFRIITLHPYNRFYLLTKQPQNLVKFSPFPDNCWIGVTAMDYWRYVDACNYLARIEAKVKYISFEPLLKWDSQPCHFTQSAGIGWYIIGAQTKPYKPPKIEWVEEIVEAADKAGIPVFLKDNLKPLYPKPSYLFIRQEMPE